MRLEEGRLAGRILRGLVEERDNGLEGHGVGVAAASTAETVPGCRLI